MKFTVSLQLARARYAPTDGLGVLLGQLDECGIHDTASTYHGETCYLQSICGHANLKATVKASILHA